ncbi:zinc finger protein-like 1 isoform X2 [Syngnathoides biaculeatus]|uniref:zinc finger protein-like 1 isoform X2 n=1 Tax=Syngnathoides biaculeatus TaxID=300417 RepID=UPI002ADE6F03|nr:zinc finger protein-like 1 isoform X2 [Syngnathoides biaculeatus]
MRLRPGKLNRSTRKGLEASKAGPRWRPLVLIQPEPRSGRSQAEATWQQNTSRKTAGGSRTCTSLYSRILLSFRFAHRTGANVISRTFPQAARTSLNFVSQKAMGLCKCPKRKVTNLFCFEHRVNVCEHCLVSNHNKCIVQSYLQWLQDSDYNPNCPLCDNQLIAEDTIRLICYDVFHWSCLNDLASRLPLHTAPAGYQCPSCQGPLFPPSNLASPVASVLKEQLSSVNWARAGLGLPLISALEPDGPADVRQEAADVTDYTEWSSFDERGQSPPHHGLSYNAGLGRAPNTPEDDAGLPRKDGDSDLQAHSAVDFPDAADCDTITIHAGSSPRKVYDTRENNFAAQMDFDDDKYRRRPALGWFAQILKNRTGTKRASLSWKQRVFVLLLIGVLGFFTLIIIMAKVGRASASSDPNLDPLLNPHIRVGKN